MKKRYTKEQIAYALKRNATGVSAPGIGVTELRKMKALEEENRQLKKLAADLSLDKHMLQEVLAKKF